MRESVTYQEILEEERQQVVVNLLKEEIPVDVIARVTGVSIEQVRQIQADQEQDEEKRGG